MIKKPTSPAKPVNLSEYAEEVIPFDVVIRKLGKVKTVAKKCQHLKLQSVLISASNL